MLVYLNYLFWPVTVLTVIVFLLVCMAWFF